jgi:hypothetical protein
MTLFRITLVQDISTLVDLKPGENPLFESVFNVQPGTAFENPDDLEEFAVAHTEEVTMGVFGSDGKWRAIAVDDEPEYIVMAHYSDEV